MVHEIKKRIPSKIEVNKIKVANCVKCSSDQIKIEEYEDQFGFISTATCKKCKNEVKVNASEIAVVRAWNKNNHIPTLIRDKKSLIKKLQSEIVRLEKKV